MDKKIIAKLKQDEHYYGDYGKQFLSNSDIHILLKNPRLLREDKPKSTAMVIGGYFHTAILEPNKLKSFKGIPKLDTFLLQTESFKTGRFFLEISYFSEKKKN